MIFLCVFFRGFVFCWPRNDLFLRIRVLLASTAVVVRRRDNFSLKKKKKNYIYINNSGKTSGADAKFLNLNFEI